MAAMLYGLRQCTRLLTTSQGQELPPSAADWQQQQQLAHMHSKSSGSGVLSPELSAEAHAADTAGDADANACHSSTSAAGLQQLRGRRASSSGSSNPAASELQRSLAAWDTIFDCSDFNHQSSSIFEPGSPACRLSSSSGGAAGCVGSQPAVYPLPYALLKVVVRLPSDQTAPDWLQQLMESERLTPVEDWSKFVHGCAVLLPEAVRAVPYWMDDELIELSVTALQAQLEAEEARRDQLRLLSLRPPSRLGSAGSVRSTGGGGAGSGSGGGASAGVAAGQVESAHPLLQRLSSSFISAVGRAASSSGVGGAAAGGGTSGDQLMPQHHSAAGAVLMSPMAGDTGVFGNSSSVDGHGASRMRVSWADGGTPRSSSAGGDTPRQINAAAAAAGLEVSYMSKLWRKITRRKPPPLFRPQGSSR